MGWTESFFLIGMTLGIFSSMPIGPINLTLIGKFAERRKLECLSFVIGVLLADLSIAAMAIWLADLLSTYVVNSDWVRRVGGLILIAYGVIQYRSLYKSGPMDRGVGGSGKASKMGFYGSFFLGLVFCAGNPAFLAFWVSSVAVVEGRIGSPFSTMEAITFLSGVVVGDAVWFALLSFLAVKSVRLIVSLTRPIQGLVGTLCLILGISALI